MAATHALVVGVGQYADAGIKTLKADVDAEVVAAKLEDLGASVTKLLNEEATKTAVLRWFSAVHVYRGDLVYIYLAGHGGSVPDGSGRDTELGAFYPYDVKMNTLGGLSGGATADSAITENDLTYGISERLKGCHVVVFLVSCKSGLIAKEDPAGDSQLVVRGEGAFVPRGLASGVRDADDPGMTFVFASSDEHEPSFENPDSEPPHGLFTRSLLNGLVCDADIAPADGTITYSELKAHVIRNMAELSESPARRGYVQTPVVLCSPEAAESESFVLARQACELTIRSVGAAVQSEVAVETPREEGDDELVVFPDPALDRAVRKALRKAEGEPITKGACRSVRWLIAVEKGIASLAGLEALTGLTNLDLRANGIADLSPLAGLEELEWLALSKNQIVDLTPMAGLRGLAELDLSWNLISDITPLVGLSALRALEVRGNQIVNLSPLASLQGLGTLQLSTNSIRDLSPLAGLASLQWLSLGQNHGLRDLMPLSGLTSLTFLNVTECGVSNIGPLAGLSSLETLVLYTNAIEDIGPIAGLTSLRVLYIGWNDIRSIEAIGSLSNLEELYAKGLRWGAAWDRNLEPLTHLAHVAVLDLRENSLTDISSLLECAGLGSGDTLRLGGNRLCLDAGSSSRDAIDMLISRGVDVAYGSQVDPACSEVVVTFLDAGLEAAIREATGKPAGDVLMSDLEGLTALDAASRGIANLDVSPPTALWELGWLDLSGNEIVDLAPLSGLARLWSLNLGGNRIADLTPLAGLGELEWLNVSGNQIGDLSPLVGSAKLTMLYAGGNQIIDIVPLSRLTELTVLGLGENGIIDLAPLAGLTQLSVLDLGGNLIADVTPLAGLTGLTELYLSRNKVADLTPLSGLPELRELGLALNEVLDLAPLVGLTKLTMLYVGGNQIVDLVPLSGLKGLTVLDLSGNRIADLMPLQGLTELATLWLHGNKRIADLAPLARLTQLRSLNLGGNLIADVTPLAGLTGLTWLYLTGNYIVDVTALSGLTELTGLHLGMNWLSDLAPLAGLTQLSVLDLSDNLIVDVTPLAGLTGLTELNLSRNNVAELSSLSGLPVFPEIGWEWAAGRTMVFASSREHEPAFEDPSSSPPHGLFTQVLVDGLSCAADSDLDGVVTYSEMAEYLTETMAQRTASLQGPGHSQTPVSTGAPADDETSAFPICSTLCGTAVQTAAGTHALVVGVGVYQDRSFGESKADLDAEVFAETLRDLGVAHVTLLTNERATRQEIGMWFVRVAPQPGDTIYIYLAGHGGGIADRSGREAEIGAFLPYDAQSPGAGWDRGDVVEESVISEHDLSTWVATYLSYCNVVLFIDASRSALLAR